MHELAIVERLVRVLEDAARREKVERIRKVRLEMGALSGIVKESVLFCFEIVSQGTVVEGAELEILTPPGQAKCLDCENSFEVLEFALACPECGGYRIDVLSGTQMVIKDMEV